MGVNMIKQRDLGPWLVFIMLCIFTGLINFVGKFFTETNKELDIPTPTYTLSIENHSFCTSRYGTRAICGTVLNNSANSYSLVSLDINLYDKDGALIGNTYDNIRDLEAGRQWKFEAPCSVSATGYSIKVKGY